MGSRNDFEEQYAELLLKRAAEEFAAEKDMEAKEALAPFAEAPQVNPPQGFVRQMNRLQKRRQREEQGPSTHRWKRMAACLLLALGLGTGLLATDTHALLQNFHYFVLQDRGAYSSLTLEDERGENVAQ